MNKPPSQYTNFNNEMANTKKSVSLFVHPLTQQLLNYIEGYELSNGKWLLKQNYTWGGVPYKFTKSLLYIRLAELVKFRLLNSQRIGQEVHYFINDDVVGLLNLLVYYTNEEQ